MSSLSTQKVAPAGNDASTTSRTPHTRATLVVAMLGFAVVTLDTQVVNVALPDINRDFGGDLTGLQWWSPGTP